MRFDSIKEKNRYNELMILLKAGEISDLRLQQDFTLIEAFTDYNGVRHRAERYKADFTYTRKDGKYIVEDVKGGSITKTKTYEIKKKQMMDKYGISIREV